MNTWPTDPEFASFFRASPNAIIALDPRGTVIALNDACSALGCFERDLLGRRIDDIAGAPLQRFVSEALAKNAHGETLQRSLDLFCPDGSIIASVVTGIPVTENPDVRVTLLHIADVRAQTQLQYRFRSLFERNSAALLELDRQLAICDVNSAMLNASGYGPDDLLGNALTDFALPSRRDATRQSLSRALAGETLLFPLELHAKSGRLLHYEATAFPVLSRGIVGGVYVSLEDLAERISATTTEKRQRAQFNDLERDFRALFEQNPDGVASITAEGIVEHVNAAALEILHVAPEHVAGKHFEAFVPEAERERARGFFERARTGETLRYDGRAQRPGGANVELDITLLPRHADNEVTGVYALFKDVSQRQADLRDLHMQAERMRQLYDLATRSDHGDAQLMAALETGCRLLQTVTGAIVEISQTSAVDIRSDEKSNTQLPDEEIIAAARLVEANVEHVCADPTGLWIGARLEVGGTLHGVLVFLCEGPRVTAFAEADREMVALMAALIATALERRRTRLHLRALAYYDSLTGLPNRLFFQERLRDALVDMRGRVRPAAVLFIDLDRFKDINETLGHAMGDRFLQLVANRLVRSAGDNAAVARMGGDEFIVLLLDSKSPVQVRDTAETILRSLDAPYEIDGFEQYITASIGATIFPQDGRDDQTLIKKAEIAMYRAKERGGNSCFFYTHALEAPIRNRLSQEKLLRRAIARDEFVLHFQPILETQTQRVVSLEALVRWNHPERGLVFPDEFIGVAEATGLILPLGEWVASRAACDLVDLRAQFGDLCMAINLSARQFHQADLSERLAGAIAKAGLCPVHMEMEITETMTLIDASSAIETVRRLKAIGARIAVDDFGTGHSSLNYLRRFEVDYIKVDRTFVAGIGLHSNDETIIKAIVAMGHSLGMQIIAEGVETKEQAGFLAQNGCDRLQGYLFSPPVALDPLREVLKLRCSAASAG